MKTCPRKHTALTLNEQNNEAVPGKNWRPNVNRRVSLVVKGAKSGGNGSNLRGHPVRIALDVLSMAKQRLRELGVLRSERVTGEIGEYFACELFGYTRAVTTSNKGWDLLGPKGQKIQVKSHAKGPGNRCRKSEINDLSQFDELVIIVMSPEYRLHEVYRISSRQVSLLAGLNTQTGKIEVPWNALTDFSVNPLTHPSEVWKEFGTV